MDQTPERYRNPDAPGYPTKDEVEAAWLKLVVQPALLEEVRRIQRPRSEAAARIREAVKTARTAPPAVSRQPPLCTVTSPRRESLWVRLLHLLRRR